MRFSEKEASVNDNEAHDEEEDEVRLRKKAPSKIALP